MPAQINTEPMRQRGFAVPHDEVVKALAPQIAKWIKKNNATTRTTYQVGLEYKVPVPAHPGNFNVTPYTAEIRITAINGDKYIVDLYDLK